MHASAVLSGGIDPFGDALPAVPEDLDNRTVYKNMQR